MGRNETVVKLSFKEQMLRAREEAIVQTVNRLLAEKGFDAMTVDDLVTPIAQQRLDVLLARPEREADLLGDGVARLVLCLAGAGTQVRGHHHRREAEQRRLGGGLLLEHVERRTRNLPRLQCFMQRRFVDQPAGAKGASPAPRPRQRARPDPRSRG